MRKLAVVLYVLGSGCGPTNSQYDGSPSHDAPADALNMDGPPPTTITCQPTAGMCIGTQMWTCTLSGHDAVGGYDCALQGTATNPSGCTTSACPSGAGVCCKRMHDVCDYDITSPVLLSGTSCNPPVTTQNFSCGTFSVSEYYSAPPSPNTCSTDYYATTVVIDRSMHVAGATFSLGATDLVYFQSTIGSNTASCSSWNGNILWVSDIPGWRVDVDLTCKTGSTHLVASFHGTI